MFEALVNTSVSLWFWLVVCFLSLFCGLLSSRFYFRVDKEDEIECLISGCNFLLKNILDEAFVYQRHGNPDYHFQGVDQDMFPYLLVNIGSGVSLVKVRIVTSMHSKCL